MACPHGQSAKTSKRAKKTCLGYRTFACRACHRTFNERTGTPFNLLEYPTEQDHRGIKQRYRPMRGFGAFASAARFCVAFDEVRHFFRPHTTMNQAVSLAQRRRLFMDRFQALKTLIEAA